MTRLPPGPRGLVRGVLLPLVRSIRDPMGNAQHWLRTYGDPMTAAGIDGRPIFWTGRPEGIRALFTAPPESYSSFGTEQLGSVLGEASLLVLSGPKHTALRKLLLPPFHGQRMRIYGRQIRDLTLHQTRELGPGARFVAQDLMHEISMQTIIQLVFGVTAPERIERAAQLTGGFRRAFDPSRLLFMLAVMIPWLRREFFGLGPWAALQRAIRALHAFVGEDLEQRRAEPAERTDILSLLMEARYDDGTGLTDREICEQLQTLLFAGHSTTAIALTWALYLLLRNPHVLSRLQEELIALGPDIEPEALAKVPFLDAVCSETMRIRPLIGGVARRLRVPMSLLGYELPAGMSVGASVLWAHSNPEIYPEPDQFLPDRFLGRTFSPFEFLPFGGGNRRCIGAAFALFEMKIVLGTLLRHYFFELASQKPVRVLQRDTLIPSEPIQLIVRPGALQRPLRAA
jgi:cytochrome P450